MKSCLIVDDSKVIRKVARHILETLEFEVEEAGDGQEALSRCEQKMPDVVRALVHAGASVLEVTTEDAPLEDVYFTLIESAGADAHEEVGR